MLGQLNDRQNDVPDLSRPIAGTSISMFRLRKEPAGGGAALRACRCPARHFRKHGWSTALALRFSADAEKGKL
jgi:hypothetical protein